MVISDQEDDSPEAEIDTTKHLAEDVTSISSTVERTVSQDIQSQERPISENVLSKRNIEVSHPASGPSSFSVSIEDEKGNIIVVSKIDDMVGTDAQTSGLGFIKKLGGGDSQVSGHSDRPEGLSLQVKEESGRAARPHLAGKRGRKGLHTPSHGEGKGQLYPHFQPDPPILVGVKESDISINLLIMQRNQVLIMTTVWKWSGKSGVMI